MRSSKQQAKLRIQKAFVVLFFLACLVWGLSVWPQRSGQTMVLNQPSATDLYAAGKHIRLTAPVNGDAVLAGRDITIDGEVRADVMAAGRSVQLESRVFDDVRVAAWTVLISAPIDGHLVGAGRNIELSDGVVVRDWAWLAGQTVKMYADIGGDLKVAGETVVLDGKISGSVDVLANALTLRPNTVIVGDLIWRGVTAPQISDQARIEGQLIRAPAEFEDVQPAGGLERLFLVLSIALIAVTIGFLAPGVGRQNERIVRERPVIVFVCALLFIVVLPIIIVLSMLTGIGFLLSGLLLVLFMAALMASSALGLAVIARVATGIVSISPVTYVHQIAAILLVAVVVWLLSFVPGAFAAIVFMLMLVGLGTTLIQAYRARRYWDGGTVEARRDERGAASA